MESIKELREQLRRLEKTASIDQNDPTRRKDLAKEIEDIVTKDKPRGVLYLGW